MSELPLEQRTSGRRAQRRRQRQDDEIHRPSADIEARIQQAIEKRTLLFQGDANATYEPDAVIEGNYEYLDHTADIQLHSWGNNLEEALEQLVVAMFGYMTQLNLVQINQVESNQYASNIAVQGHDDCSLVFAFLQEWLCVFHETNFLVKQVKIEHLDHTLFRIKSSAQGERADWSRHVQGTEVKAVTYSNLQVVHEPNGEHHIWVIVDI